jgi:hypothetical protein
LDQANLFPIGMQGIGFGIHCQAGLGGQAVGQLGQADRISHPDRWRKMQRHALIISDWKRIESREKWN